MLGRDDETASPTAHRSPNWPVLSRRRRCGWSRPWPQRERTRPSTGSSVQMHQCALSSSTDNGCDAAIRQAWVPLFDQYQVDLVVKGHDHDYERSFPVRGFTADLGTFTWSGVGTGPGRAGPGRAGPGRGAQ